MATCPICLYCWSAAGNYVRRYRYVCLWCLGKATFCVGDAVDKRWNSDRIHDIWVHNYPRSRVIEYPQPVNVTDSYVYPTLNPTHKGCVSTCFCLRSYLYWVYFRCYEHESFVSIFGTLCIVFAIAVVVFNDELYIHEQFQKI